MSRYVPPLKGIVEGLIEGSLPTDKYPFAKESTASMKMEDKGTGVSSRKSAQPRWASDKSKRKNEVPSTSGPRFIVFVAGGCTFAEMRTIYEVAQASKKEILLGTTAPLTPKQFVEGLKAIQKIDTI